MHVLLYCLQPATTVSWAEVTALRRLESLLALVPVAVLPRALRGEQAGDARRRFVRDSLAGSLHWWSWEADAASARAVGTRVQGPAPLFLIARAEGGDLPLLWTLLLDHIGPAGAATANAAAETRARQRAHTRGLGLGACAGTLAGALAAVALLRLFNRQS